MAGGPPAGGSGPGGVLDLLPLASARPDEALAKARAILAADPPPYEASVAHHAIGMLLREFGDLDAATAELQAAVRLARLARSASREADVLASLGVALIYRGHSGRGLAALGSSLTLVTGPPAARILVRRGIALWVLGRHREALDDLGRAVRILRPAGDTIWEARALTARALVHLASGSAHQAELDLSRADHLYAATSQDVEVAFTWHNRGLVAFRSGDLPTALACLNEAGRRYERLTMPRPDLAADRCAVLLAAGLPADAFAETDAAVRGFPRSRAWATKRAELLLSAARAALAAGEPGLAAARAGAARRMFTTQGRDWWRAHAGLLLLQAHCAARPASARLLRQSEQVAADLDAAGSGDAAQARLLAGTSPRPRWSGATGLPRWPGPRGGSPRRCVPTWPVTGGGCWPPAVAASPSSMSTGSAWARPNSGPKPPRTVPNWPRWRSGPPCNRAGRGCCWPGAKGGGRRRTRCRRPGPPTTASSRPT